ncbi:MULTISPECIES: hypothetical protein [Gulosibacter]|uniref:hypothetical protein n=1 Tax=Gulosibacter TaxID=256818 RepID=UPI00191AD6AB|nr:hypothetical protein [Gulosibacter hominis]
MLILKGILLVLHFVGLAALFGVWFSQIKDIVRGEGRMLPGMLHGAGLMLVSGVLLVGITEMSAELGMVNHMKIGIKLLVLVAIFVLLLAFRNKPEQRAPKWALWLVGGLALLNICIAVLWS